MHKRPLAVIAAFFISGIVLGRFLPDSVGLFHVFVVTLILITLTLILSLKREREAHVFLFLSIISLGSLLYLSSNIFPPNHISRFLGKDKLKTDIIGVIESPALTRKPYYGKISSAYLFDIEQIEDESVTGLARIRIKTERDYEYGDRLLVRGTIKRPRLPLIPTLSPEGRGSRYFNYREYLERQNIFALINTKENNVTVLSRDYKSNPVLKYIYLSRERLKGQIIEKMPLEYSAFLNALLLGDRSELPECIQKSFKDSGTMHVLAISGLHVGLIVFFILYMLRLLRVKREWSYCFMIIFLIFFALFTLSRPSVIRAVIMAGVFLIGILMGRKVDIYNSLALAALFILIKNPKDLFNVGFQLSFMAVFFIAYLTPRFMGIIPSNFDFRVKRYVLTSLMVSASAWIGTFPLVLYYFKVVTPIAIFSNLLMIPVISILLIGGLGFALLGWVPFIGAFLAGFNSFFCGIIFYLADLLSSLRFGHFYL
jgi:competence protein ComEC